MLSGIGPSRRGFLFGTGAFALANASFPATGWATTSERIVALDWVSGMNLLGLGIVPAAMPELEHYTRLVVEPTLSQTTIELGLRSEPNLELIDSLKPSLIVRNTDAPLAGAELSSIAPVHIFDDRFSVTVNPLEAGRTAMAKLASQLGAASRFQMAQNSFSDAVSEARKLLGNYDGRPLVIATVIDGRRLLIFGKNSLVSKMLGMAIRPIMVIRR
jgi:iron complex transport system substrate-binding protein